MRAACASAWLAGERINASRRSRSVLWSSSSWAISEASGGGSVASGIGADPSARRSRRASRSNLGAIRSQMSRYARSRRCVSRARSQGTPARRPGGSSLRRRSNQEIWTSTSRASPVARARSRSRRRSLAGTTASSCGWYARSVLRSRRIATRKSCRASASSASASRSRAALAASSRFTAMRRAAPGAGVVRRPSGRLGIRGPEESEVLGTEKPIERGCGAGHPARELEQAGRALAELEERSVGGGEQGADQSAEIGLVAHDRHATARVPGREPSEHSVEPRARRGHRHAIHWQAAVGGRDDLRGVERPLVGTRGQHIQLGNEHLQPERRPLHLAASLRRKGPVRIVLVRARERLAIFRDGVPHHEEAHGTRGSGGRGLALGSPREGGPAYDRHERRADIGALAGGFAGEVLERDLGPQRRLAVAGGASAVGAVGEQLAHLDGVREDGLQDVPHDARLKRWILDREERFDPSPEVARHPVGAGQKDLGIAAVLEVENAAVLEVLVHDARDPDGLRNARKPGTQAADAPDHELDGDAALRGAVQGVDDRRLDEGVHLHDDPRGATFARVALLTLDQADDLLAHADGGDHQLPPAVAFGVSGEQVEQGARILAHVGIGEDASALFNLLTGYAEGY